MWQYFYSKPRLCKARSKKPEYEKDVKYLNQKLLCDTRAVTTSNDPEPIWKRKREWAPMQIGY